MRAIQGLVRLPFLFRAAVVGPLLYLARTIDNVHAALGRRAEGLNPAPLEGL
jgi:hypothetical protein